MPGPSNKKKQKGKSKQKRHVKEAVPALEEEIPELEDVTVTTPVAQRVEEAMFEPPFIHDPGNGPRVKDVKMFLKSSFAQPVAQGDEVCREFGQIEVLEMLQTILPEDTALILWYNKSRAKSRICPSCLRLYDIGSELADHSNLGDLFEDSKVVLSARLLREQELSGFCSPVCFVLASYDCARAIKSAWGHTGDEMSDESWSILNEEDGNGNGDGDELRDALGLVVKMTRLEDLGLLQLCFE